jgi:hypothetical protein
LRVWQWRVLPSSQVLKPNKGRKNQKLARELIVLAAPRADDPYYAKIADDFFDFQVAYAKFIEANDAVVVLTGRTAG